MANEVVYLGSKLGKTEVLRAIAEGLQQLSIDVSEEEEPIYTYNTKVTKNGVDVKCTDGTKIELLLKKLG